MKITVITVGKLKEAFYREAVSEYGKRLSRYCKLEIREVEDEKTMEGASDKAQEQILAK
ncbi:MAG: 23S rRNA (pseudouridine(1915)-N(3))-methyltransferase RlmH, partial [Lachnospiraceae bacterium]|nr:23S rRNA (pseudouridine(1915)-N(3))-methyltransferase RlmH [Lachnospiraceae bacterium]